MQAEISQMHLALVNPLATDKTLLCVGPRHWVLRYLEQFDLPADHWQWVLSPRTLMAADPASCIVVAVRPASWHDDHWRMFNYAQELGFARGYLDMSEIEVSDGLH